VGAREAVDLGLAIAAVPEDELEAAVDDLVAALLSAPAGALRETKGLLRAAVHRDADEQLAAERAAQARCLAELANALRP
jgi:enoyl-CoA hydratase/carnithine racemase